MRYLIRYIFRKFGFDIQKSSESQFASSVQQLLKLHDIDTVLDVGANRGQYASWLVFNGYRGRILSFEPQKIAHDLLLINSRGNKNWEIAQPCALGNANGEIEINISKNSVSSSILGMTKKHLDADPESRYVEKQNVKIYKLDDFNHEFIKQSRSIFLKLDVQGFEKEVIDGAAQIIKHKIKGIQLEMSIVRLYDGEMIFEEYLNLMKSLGYNLNYLNPGITSSGKLLQVDGIFFKE